MVSITKPDWIKKRISPQKLVPVKKILAATRLNTVCEEAQCPNIGECFSAGAATMLILGRICTRNCRFCAVTHGITHMPDPDEPQRIAEAIYEMRLKYIVITSVTRDDLKDGGASHFAATIGKIKALDLGILTEVLIPDFKGDVTSLKIVLDALPTVLSHNVETVPRLYPKIRPQAILDRSLDVLRMARQMAPKIPVKSGFMLGLGETTKEVLYLLRDLRRSGCELLTIGQYLQPHRNLHPVMRYIHPDEFEFYRTKAIEIGFKGVAAGPFVRSSYRALQLIETQQLKSIFT